MRKLLNTIYVTNEQMYLMLDGENLVCKAEGETKLRIPFENVENIVCFSYLGCSPALMGKCVEKLIPINFMSPQGKFLAKVCVPLWMIEKELISPKSKNDKVNPALMAGLLNAVVYGGKYPVALFENTLRRIRIDRNINRIRCGIVKAYLNRNDKKEEITVGLNEENKSPAYLCGRLFAVLEQLQKDAAGTELNRTIKDAYFASASVKPALIFPKLIRLSQNHLKKIKNANYRYKYNERIQKIIELLDGKFPEMLRRTEQGEFFVGYYQQIPELFKKSEKKEEQ